MESVTHQGREIAYRVVDRGGDGNPVLFVHGSGGTHEIWKAQLARLASEFPVVALDLSGHGGSEDVDSDPGWGTLSAYAGDVLAVAEATDAKTFVGNSLGGAVVMHLVLERDFEPEALVLAGTGARLSVLDDLLSWLDDDFDRAVEFLHGGDRLFHDPDDRYVELSKESMYTVGQRVTSRDFHSCHAFDVCDEIDGIAAPTLAIVGEYDMLTPPWYHEFLAENVQDGSYAEIEGAAHLAMLETPDAFNETVVEFLDGAR
ncbi:MULTISPECIES: alpha/beta fold hydrolase [unclassified Haladaptatus]|uniref:alpha/beta fold hydrolase n=1 Tax=unclassified Haladaptatus TaxID=2622732 RepID=UPI00209BDDFF|nr:MULTISPECIES: alpha/beta fold hydrolase [unclassified Haladaptatus]MCO8245205.1 alpha/beta hydrolase [Haladaptatus sp. AB643]MCO8253349.1 alpha/beta hydrolase [Haladaptatus sp. AB618]